MSPITIVSKHLIILNAFILTTPLKEREELRFSFYESLIYVCFFKTEDMLA